MSSSLSLVPSSRRSIGKENNENSAFTGMHLGLKQLEERIIATTTITCNTTQLRNVPSVYSIVGCDITVEDIQTAKKELINQKFDLKMDVKKIQKLTTTNMGLAHDFHVTPLFHFCLEGNLLIIKILFLIGADCTKLCGNNSFPMLAAAAGGHLDICQWLFKYGGDAKYQINKETILGDTPLRAAYDEWNHGSDKEGKICRWLLLNGGGQNLSPKAMRELRRADEKEEWNSNLLVLWMREHILLHDTFILLLCGATTMITPSSEPDDGGTRKRKQKHTRQRKIHQERSLQILDNHLGIMELIGDYFGLIRGKEFRLLQEFNELVIDYNNAYHSSSDDDDDDDDESTSDDDNDNGEDEDEE